MIKNYLKVAVRSIFRNKLTAFINIAGLALSIGCSVLIAFFIKDELSFDRYHSKADRTYRVTRDFLSPDGSVALHLGHVAPPFGSERTFRQCVPHKFVQVLFGIEQNEPEDAA